jgi:hypothetical protein
LLAAFAGSYGASRYAERKKEHDELLTEIRNTDAATMTAFVTCNLAINFKSDTFGPLKHSYDLLRIGYLMHGFWWQQLRGRLPEYEVLLELQGLPPMSWPIDLLQETLFGKVDLTGRPLAAIATLNQIYYSLNYGIKSHNERVADLIKQSPLVQSEIAFHYLSLPNKQGHRDERFANLMDSIYSHTDSCIYFTELLCKDLHEYRIDLRRKFNRKFLRKLHEPDPPDFSAPRAKGLMPDPSNFDSWERWIVKKPAPKNCEIVAQWLKKQWRKIRGSESVSVPD